MIVFCHLLNDRSGSPQVLHAAIAALGSKDSDNRLYIGSQGRGVLEECDIQTEHYWYRRSRFRLVTLFTYIFSQILLYIKLSRARDIPADAVIYVNTLLPFGAALWGRRTGRKVVYHLHEVSVSPRLLRRFLCGMVGRNADLILYVSKDHRARLPIAGVRALTLSNPIAPALHKIGAETPYSPRRAGVFTVLMLASLRDFKGLPEFMRLAESLLARDDIRFTLVLNATQSEVGAYTAAVKVPENVALHPRTAQPAGFYAMADVLLNLSRVDMWVETFGLTLAEAMGFGVPVIAPPLGGPAEMVENGIDGYLIDSRDHAALCAALMKLADNPALCMALSAAARRKADAVSWPEFATGLRAALAEPKKSEGI